MFCPLCGSKLHPVPNPDEERYDREDQAWIDNDYEGDLPKPMSRSEHWKCEKKRCLFSGVPLIKHHPHHGTESKPGDSWSLSWVK